MVIGILESGLIVFSMDLVAFILPMEEFSKEIGKWENSNHKITLNFSLLVHFSFLRFA